MKGGGLMRDWRTGFPLLDSRSVTILTIGSHMQVDQCVRGGRLVERSACQWQRKEERWAGT
jgi:hypothetical protein